MNRSDKNNLSTAGSFRDPSGFVFQHEGKLYRQINQCYKENYDLFLSSGLYEELVDKGLLVPHREVSRELAPSNSAYKVIAPTQIDFISYPYEWCFSQLKDAAVTTLKIQKLAIEKGMMLKDASAYNIQFKEGKPVFIDTLSFEKSNLQRPWVAYCQFCQHFLAPLALMAYRDIRLSQLFRVFIDGIPLDLASSLLPGRTKLSFALLSHIHLHARSQSSYSDKQTQKKDRKISSLGFLGLMNSLGKAIDKLNWNPGDTEWSEYYDDTNYSQEAFIKKQELVASFLDQTDGKKVWDLGANTGVFSRIASKKGFQTISFDIDFSAVEKNHRECVKNGEKTILALVLDLTNPSPDLGWHNQERSSLLSRGPADTVLALALIHHLAISNNLPFSMIAGFFANICQSLIIEFIPKEDSQVQRLLASREDIFPDYHQHHFEEEFKKIFRIEEKKRIEPSQRILYRMRKH